MCQHFSGHKFRQLFAVFRTLLVTSSHFQNEFSLDYKKSQYIQILIEFTRTEVLYPMLTFLYIATLIAHFCFHDIR